MQIIIVDMHEFPSALQRRAVRQLPRFGQFDHVAHDVPVSPVRVDELAGRAEVRTLRSGAEVLFARPPTSIAWLTLRRDERTEWDYLTAVDAELYTVLHACRDAYVVVTSTYSTRPDSMLGVRAPPGVRLPPLPTQTNVHGLLMCILCHAFGLTLPTALPPPVSRFTDVTALLVCGDTNPLEARRLWVQVVVPRPDRCTGVVVTFRFGLRDLVQVTDDEWEAATDAERSRWVEGDVDWPVPTSNRVVHMHDMVEDPETNLYARPGLAEAAMLSEALRRVGPTVRVKTPSSVWLCAPCSRERSVRVGGERRDEWLPWALSRRLPHALPLRPCTAWIPEDKSSPAFFDVEHCPNDWAATGESATYLCADHVVHAVVIRRRRASAHTVTRGTARATRRPIPK